MKTTARKSIIFTFIGGLLASAIFAASASAPVSATDPEVKVRYFAPSVSATGTYSHSEILGLPMTASNTGLKITLELPPFDVHSFVLKSGFDATRCGGGSIAHYNNSPLMLEVIPNDNSLKNGFSCNLSAILDSPVFGSEKIITIGEFNFDPEYGKPVDPPATPPVVTPPSTPGNNAGSGWTGGTGFPTDFFPSDDADVLGATDDPEFPPNGDNDKNEQPNRKPAENLAVTDEDFSPVALISVIAGVVLLGIALIFGGFALRNRRRD